MGIFIPFVGQKIEVHADGAIFCSLLLMVGIFTCDVCLRLFCFN